MEEIWKPITGYEDLYEVSNLGRVKSLARRIKIVCKHKTYYKKKQEQILKPEKFYGPKDPDKWRLYDDWKC